MGYALSICLILNKHTDRLHTARFLQTVGFSKRESDPFAFLSCA